MEWVSIQDDYELPIALDVRDVAKLLDCHPVTVRNMIQHGELRAVRLGRLVRVPREALNEFLAGNQMKKTSTPVA